MDMAPEPARAPRILIVSASDSRYFFLIRGLLASLGSRLARPNVEFACFDLGLDAADRSWLGSYTANIAVPGTHFGLDRASHDAVARSFLVRPFLPDYFPGHDIYVWIDSDVWFQNGAGFDGYVDGALRHGIAVAHERERAYAMDPRLFAWGVKHAVRGFGVSDGVRLVAQPQINAGIFAIARDAPAWQAWARAYEAAIGRTRRVAPYDQVSLNATIYSRPASRAGSPAPKILTPAWNWICSRGAPMWHDGLGMFCKPYPPYDPVHAVHLAGPGKHREFQVRRTGGGSFTTMLIWGCSPDHPIRA